ncbi:hypothetical protein DAEQUDRAFT_721075 [Daedalea quercina L-15889]|uniref:Uncharacterized protein n=1 Tax=Daedalea quercina L-15889 TaxID=1314783 RepID=A0A165TZU2_9APHY|nr:hypothetical protein DAEQUDRAFT_721075 [Daedalea quercina L-15889]
MAKSTPPPASGRPSASAGWVPSQSPSQCALSRTASPSCAPACTRTMSDFEASKSEELVIWQTFVVMQCACTFQGMIGAALVERVDGRELATGRRLDVIQASLAGAVGSLLIQIALALRRQYLAGAGRKDSFLVASSYCVRKGGPNPRLRALPVLPRH